MDIRAAINLVEGVQQLDELQGVKTHTAQVFQSKQDVIEYLTAKGFTLLGDGGWGQVYDHPKFNGRFVLKVFSDRFYEAFLAYCAARPDNPHLPKIVGKVVKLTDTARMVRIERLEPITDEYFSEHLDDLVGDAFEWPHLKNDPEHRKRMQANVEAKGATVLFQTLIDIVSKCPKRCENDIGPENVMLRGQTIVITDPWAGDNIPFLK